MQKDADWLLLGKYWQKCVGEWGTGLSGRLMQEIALLPFLSLINTFIPSHVFFIWHTVCVKYVWNSTEMQYYISVKFILSRSPEKKSSFVVLIERMYVCGFVALCVRMSIAGANEVEGTMSWCLGTIEILASKHDIAQGQTRVLWDRHLDCSQFLHLLWRIKVIRSLTLKYLHDSNAAYSDVAV